jgi:CRP-like cAMP-binding protein
VNPDRTPGRLRRSLCPVEPPSNEHRTRRGTLRLANVTLKGIAVLFDTCPSNRLRRELDVALFADCTNRELRRIDTLSTVTTREAGQVLCREGEIGRECFVLLDGQVDVDTSGGHYTVDAGAPLGEIALLITNGRRSATLTARTDVTLLVFSRPEFTELMQGLPMVAHKILNEATRRLVENAEARSAPAS